MLKHRSPVHAGLLALPVTAVLLAGCGSDTASTAAGHGGHMSASASSVAASASGGGSQTTAASPAASARNAADVMFAQMMIPHHEQAVQMAELAATRAGSPQVKQLASSIAAAQGPEIQQMQSWLAAWGAPSAAAGDHAGHGGMPGMMSEQDMGALRAATGRDFDRRFLDLMIRHHTGAVEMAKTEQAEGADGQAKALAKRIESDQLAEIAQMRKLLSTM